MTSPATNGHSHAPDPQAVVYDARVAALEEHQRRTTRDLRLLRWALVAVFVVAVLT